MNGETRSTTAGAAPSLPPLGHWWERPLRIIQLNLTVPDASANGTEMARRTHEYGANALLINAGGIYAFYPTDVPFHRRAPGLAGDPLGDAIGYCHDHGLRVVVRYDLIGLHRDAYEAHPEWCYRAPDGRPMIDKGLYMTCPNGGWWQERFFVLWDELTERYAVDGLFFNAWGHKEGTREGEYFGPCHCHACSRLFRERYGRLPPAGAAERDRTDAGYWLNRAFRRETLDALGQRIYRYVKTRDAEVAVFAGAGHQALITGQADCTEIELHCGSTALPTGGRWRHAAGESCKLVAALGPGFASGINAVYCHVGPGRWRLSAAPGGWLGYTLAQAMANAGWPYCMMIGTLDSQADRSALPLLRELLTFARDHEEEYRALTSAAGIGLLWSQRSATEAPGWLDTTDRYVKHFRGWYDLLTRRHRLFDVLSERQLEGGAGEPSASASTERPADRAGPGQLTPAALLERYPLLIVPNAVRLSGAAAATLDAYVALGGKLIATGAPPLGSPRESTPESPAPPAVRSGVPATPHPSEAPEAPERSPGLTCLGAAQVVAEREGVSNSYFRIRPQDRTGQSPLSEPALQAIDLLPVEGRLFYVTPRAGATPLLALIPPEDYGAPEQTYFEVETEHPGLLLHRHGAGLTAYLPWEPDRAWFETGVSALGDLLDAVVEGLAPLQAVEVAAPESVELTAHRQASTGHLLIHLVNGSGGTPARWAEPSPVGGLRLRLPGPEPGPGPEPEPGPAPRVWAARAGVALTPEAAPGGYAVTLPSLGLFEMLKVVAGAG